MCFAADTSSGQGRRPCHPDFAELAVFGRHPRHQGRELAALGLALAILALPPVQSDRSRERQIQSALEVRKGRFEVRDVQNIANILVDPEGALERRNHSGKTSHALLVGVILHVLYAEKEKAARVAAFLSDRRAPSNARFG